MSYAERTSSTLVVTSLILVLTALALPIHAQTCTVPGSHASIQQAIDDPVCVMITLSAQRFAESIVVRRPLTLTGPAAGGAVVEGLVLAVGEGTEVILLDLTVENGCSPDALRTSAGALVTGNNLRVERSEALPCPATTAGRIFTDGFELGDTSNWSSAVP
jgi:nitrous oxidase accessory protein NosD